MGKQTVIANKRRGPLPTGKGVQVVVRMQPDPLAVLDKWAAKQTDRPSRPEAIRRLVELGLTIKTPKRPRATGDRASHAMNAMDEDIRRATQPTNPDEFRGAGNRRRRERRKT